MRLVQSLGLVAVLAAPTWAGAAPVTFEAADYDNSASQTTGVFRDVLNGSNIARTVDGANGILKFTGPDANITSATIYDTTPGDGGATTNVFGNEVVTVDFRLGHATASFGPFIRLNTVGGGGYLTLVQENGGSDTLRFFEAASAPGGTQTQIGVTKNQAALALNTWYTLVFTATNSGANVILDSKIYAQGDVGGTILFQDSITDTTAANQSAGQVGLRFGDNSGSVAQVVDVDNFEVVPEPASAGLVAAVGGMILMRRRRSPSR
ncbi:MAG TPA: PEP-CTERM sorting domain-containing protein [Tepidisphaeraceae bacterium]|nr:PEP-CTERM sorting domain-containing protein [Tepidisphaeraceae bacterium]